MLYGVRTLVNRGISWHPYQQFTNIEVENIPINAGLCQVDEILTEIHQSQKNPHFPGISRHNLARKGIKKQ